MGTNTLDRIARLFATRSRSTWTARRGSNFTPPPWDTRLPDAGRRGKDNDAIASPPAPTPTRDFRDALGRFATGVTVVTTDSPNLGRSGSPPTALPASRSTRRWCCGRRPNSRAGSPPSPRPRHFAIHVIGDRTSGSVPSGFRAMALAFDGTRLAAQRARCAAARTAAWRGSNAPPSPAHDGGDHRIIVAEVTRARMARRAHHLLFSQGQLWAVYKRPLSPESERHKAQPKGPSGRAHMALLTGLLLPFQLFNDVVLAHRTWGGHRGHRR